MKKVIFGTALASMALLSACSSDNELANVETSANNAIGFHVVGNKAETRATPITPDNITTTNFNVYAFTNDGTAFMGTNDNDVIGFNGINISYQGKEGSKMWNYTTPTDLRYWPTGNETPLNFYAVNPGTNNFDSDYMGLYGWEFNHDTQKIHYSCFDEFGYGKKANIDVMYGIKKNQTYTTSNGGKVKFQFKHILSQVVFQAKTALENMEVNIQEIKIHNIKFTGNFTLPATDTESGTWSLTPIPLDKNGKRNNAFTVVTGKDITVNNTVTDISSETPMLNTPQILTAWDVKTPKTKEQADAKDPAESYLEITCKIKQAGVYLFGSEREYKTLYVPFGTTWEIGKRHIYTLIFGGGYNDQGQPILQPINFDAAVEPWDENTTNNSSIIINNK